MTIRASINIMKMMIKMRVLKSLLLVEVVGYYIFSEFSIISYVDYVFFSLRSNLHMSMLVFLISLLILKLQCNCCIFETLFYFMYYYRKLARKRKKIVQYKCKYYGLVDYLPLAINQEVLLYYYIAICSYC